MDHKYLVRHDVSKLSAARKSQLTSRVRVALQSDPNVVEKAIAILYARQTYDEKCDETTRHDNRLGVRHNHGRRIARFGRWLASGRHLTGWHLDAARNLALTYAATQLMELAALKAGDIS